ncbi:MAG: PHB depolymerase family esterase [Burkholderiaceae bacterium]
MADAAGLVQSGDLLAATALIQDASRLHATQPAADDVLSAIKSRLGTLTGTRAANDVVEVVDGPTSVVRDSGRFIDGSLAFDGLQARYKLFIPGVPAAEPQLIVLLHGCTQDPDDFAAGTAMNVRAEQQGFYVLYPMQSAAANPSRCWNWYRPDDQQRDRGEPALIAGMTRDVIDRYGIDADRVYAAGLSAGGAMAAILGSRYPELFAAVGVHSGLPAGAAANIPDALSAMRSGTRRGQRTATPLAAQVPTIVFHGDRDTTVHPVNGESVIDDVVVGADAPAVVKGQAPGGKGYSNSTYRDVEGKVVAEHWIVHGLAHAWSGGNPEGTHTDADGPSATDEMLRFFGEHTMRHR